MQKVLLAVAVAAAPKAPPATVVVAAAPKVMPVRPVMVPNEPPLSNPVPW